MIYFTLVLRSTIYNYADDNTVYFIHKDFTFLKSVLESDSLNLISWFEENSMKTNPDKFQAICIGKKTYDNIETFRIGETDIKCENNVSLLGINIDFMLKFDDHVTEICKKASKQLLKLMACEVFKIVSKLSPEYIQDMSSIKTSTYNFRGERKADILRVNTTRYGLRSFRSEAPRIWNSLPNNLRVAESYPQF